MTSKEALQELKKVIPFKEELTDKVLECENIIEQDLDRLEILEQKETPMKVKDKTFFDSHNMTMIGLCPNLECKGKNLDKDYHLWEYMNYCPVCGQKLDWSEDDE